MITRAEQIDCAVKQRATDCSGLNVTCHDILRTIAECRHYPALSPFDVEAIRKRYRYIVATT